MILMMIHFPDDFGSLTEWEANQEREEFARASKMYRPLSSLMASRFTRAQFNDDDKTSTETQAGLKVGGIVTEEYYKAFSSHWLICTASLSF